MWTMMIDFAQPVAAIRVRLDAETPRLDGKPRNSIIGIVWPEQSKVSDYAKYV